MTRIAIDPARTVGRTRLDPGVEVRPGDRVTFAVDPARLYFFDPDTGHAITG